MATDRHKLNLPEKTCLKRLARKELPEKTCQKRIARKNLPENDVRNQKKHSGKKDENLKMLK